jgi:hypothetical protein
LIIIFLKKKISVELFILFFLAFAIKAKRRPSFASVEPAEISTDHNNYTGRGK